MKRATILVAALPLLAAASATRDHPLTGRWVADLDSQSGLPTDVYLIANGTYGCESCTPPRRYPADGRLRPVDPSGNVRESVTIVDSRTISTRIEQPDLRRVTTMRVARNGRTADYLSVDRRVGISGELRTRYVARRTAPGPPGSHAVSGTWQGVRYVSVPEELRTTCLTDTGDTLVYRTGTGFSYRARYDGEFVPIQGPYDGSVSVALERVSPHRLVETRRQGARTIQVRTYTVARDGRSMEMASTNTLTGVTFRATARKRRAPDRACGN